MDITYFGEKNFREQISRSINSVCNANPYLIKYYYGNQETNTQKSNSNSLWIFVFGYITFVLCEKYYVCTLYLYCVQFCWSLHVRSLDLLVFGLYLQAAQCIFVKDFDRKQIQYLKLNLLCNSAYLVSIVFLLTYKCLL